MSMSFCVYVGPFVHVLKNENFRPWQFTEAIKERLCFTQRENGDVYLMPNQSGMVPHLTVMSRHDEEFELIKPDMEAETLAFEELIQEELDVLDSSGVKNRVKWGVFSYYL